MSKKVKVWCRFSPDGIWMGDCTNPDRICKEEWEELLTLLEEDEDFDEEGWDDPRQMELIDPESARWCALMPDYSWVRTQMLDWNMDPNYSWEFFGVGVPSDWASRVLGIEENDE